MTETKADLGRPMDEKLTFAVLEHAARVVVADGYSALDISSVAKAVGCAKTTIYRRWRNKSELVAAAFLHSAVIGEDPDTGSIVDDLVEFSLENVRNQRGRLSHIVLTLEQEVITSLWEELYGPRQERAIMMIERAIDRGQLPHDTDPLAVLDLTAGFVLFRNAVRWHEPTRDDLTRVISAVIANPPLRD